MGEAVRARQLLTRLRSDDRLKSLRVVSAGSTPDSTAPRTAWSLSTLSGRLTELSSSGGAPALTLACSMVLSAQYAGEPVGWLADDESVFFPPDVAASGIDLDALVVVRLPRVSQLPRAAEHLARSGAFGLLVIDLGETAYVPAPMQMRLLALAKASELAVLFLTRKRRDAASLGTLVSLRAEALCTRHESAEPSADRVREVGISTFTCRAQILKDKRCGPGGFHAEVCRGPDGLC